LAFVGHIDTVPVDDVDQWRFPPHGAVIQDGFLYGRGAVDMKGGVAAMIQAALYVLQNKIVPRYTVKFCFTADEEAGGMGVTSIRTAGFLEDAAAVFIPEPTEGKIGLMEKGALWLQVTATGKSSHCSRPDLGTNAVEHLIAYLDRLQSAIDLTRESDVFDEMRHSTFVVSRIKGGTKTNVVPASATSSIDIRTVFGIDHDEIIARARDIARTMSQSVDALQITVSVENNRPAIGIGREHAFTQGIAEEMRRLGLAVDYKGLHFYTDGSQIVPQFNIPFAILGPGQDALAHQRDERVPVQAVSNIANVFISYILNLDEKEKIFQ
jgi:succinyl-diaminopimelate desuccinylase